MAARTADHLNANGRSGLDGLSSPIPLPVQGATGHGRRYSRSVESVIIVIMVLSAITVAGLGVFLAWQVAKR